MSNPDARWEAYKNQVPGLAEMLEKTVPAWEDSDVEFQTLVSQLPEEISAALQATPAEPAEPDWVRAIEHRWCLCEMQEGEFPRVRLYTTLEGLTEAIAKREGQETAVWAMYGIPLKLTKAVATGDSRKLRYLLLPNQQAAPVGIEVPFQLVAQESLPENFEIEYEGWLGDAAYFNGQQFYTPGYTESADPYNDDAQDSGDPSEI